MKTELDLYPELQAALETDRLVYLFGSGMSGALSGAPCGWKRWLRDGADILRDRAGIDTGDLDGRLEQAETADALVALAGEVISLTKRSGCYHEWMRSSLGSKTVRNAALAATLRKLLAPQDVFATTNYDLLLEQAAGLETLSYEEPDAAFRMLDEGKSTAVLHIHGVYDPARGRDSIIADEAQYRKIENDQGAQFIQNLLGTRTLILVGCGQTAEDANIARFLQFANRHLKLDRRYWLLCQKGREPENLPDNVVPVPYGTERDDLQPFLEDMARVRLKALFSRLPLIGRTAFDRARAAGDPLLRYHYAQRVLPFRGRERESAALRAFLDAGDGFRWWAVTGQAGAGKSRLALETLRRLPRGWFGFFVSDRATEADAEAFAPFSDTLAVIDYVSGRERETAGMIRALRQVFEGTPFRLRVLLLERENSREDGSWSALLRQRMGRYDAEWFSSAEHGDGRFLYLEDLEASAVEALIGDVCGQYGLPDDGARDRALREAYAQKFEVLRFRPLFVQLFVEAWIENGCALPRYDRFEELLESLLRREQERWLQVFKGDLPCCNAMIRLLVRAGIAGELRTEALPELYREDWRKIDAFLKAESFPGAQRRERQEMLLSQVCQNIGEDRVAIAPLYPDIIKEYMFAYYAEEETLGEVMDELWQNAAREFSVFIRRCMTDFPEQEFFRHVMRVYDAATADTDVLRGRLELLKKRSLERGDDPRVQLDIIDSEHAFWQAVRIPGGAEDETLPETVALLKLFGLELVAQQYGGWVVDDAGIMLGAVEEMLAVPGGEAVAIMKREFLAGHIRRLSEAGFVREASRLKSALDRLLPAEAGDELAALERMINENAEMMNKIQDGELFQAAQVLKRMAKNCDFRHPTAVEMLLHSCFNLEQFAFLLKKSKYIAVGLGIAREAAPRCPEVSAVQAWRIACEVIDLQRRRFLAEDIDDAALSAALDTYDAQFARLDLEEPRATDGDPFGIAWAVLKTLRLNLISHDAAALRAIIAEADAVLERAPMADMVANTQITAIHILHKKALRDRVTSAEVEKAFAYVERFADSAVIRGNFFEMLEDSEEAGRRGNYLTDKVKAAAIQDERMNQMYGGGVPEIEEYVSLLDALADAAPGETYRRGHPKVGPNAPCPCGSGKKFKKCCRGNGLYD